MTMAKKNTPRDESGRYAYEGLDRVLHEKARLGIMTSLVTRSEGVLFNELKRLCALTDGNLSRHLDVLQEAALVEAWRGTDGVCSTSPVGVTTSMLSTCSSILPYFVESTPEPRAARLPPIVAHSVDAG